MIIHYLPKGDISDGFNAVLERQAQLMGLDDICYDRHLYQLTATWLDHVCIAMRWSEEPFRLKLKDGVVRFKFDLDILHSLVKARPEDALEKKDSFDVIKRSHGAIIAYNHVINRKEEIYMDACQQLVDRTGKLPPHLDGSDKHKSISNTKYIPDIIIRRMHELTPNPVRRTSLHSSKLPIRADRDLP